MKKIDVKNIDDISSSDHWDDILKITRLWQLEQNEESLLLRITKEIVEKFGFDRGVIFLAEKKGLRVRAFWPKACINNSEEFTKYIQDVALQVVQAGKPVFVHQMKEKVKKVPDNDTGVIYCIPLTASRGILGALYVDSKKSKKDLSRQDQKILEMLCGQAAAMIEHSLLYQSAITDPLTKLFSHRHFQMEAEQAVRQSKRSGLPVSLIIMDIDRFKILNDTKGHEAGNKCIIEVADILRNTLRISDIIARFGGDEFEMLLPGTIGRVASGIAEKIRKTVEESPVIKKYKVTVSLGVSSYPDNSGDAQTIFLRADEALYKAKEKGRNCTVLSSFVNELNHVGGKHQRGTYIDRNKTGSIEIVKGKKSLKAIKPVPVDVEKIHSIIEKIDGYRVIRHLGHGTSGEVLLVNQPELDREIALKRPLSPYLTEEQLKVFEKEAKIPASLEHPGVVSIYSMGKDADGRLYYTMKALKGKLLSDILELRKKGDADILRKFSQNRLLEILQHVAETVAFAHTRKVVHGDLTPNNIMVGEFGEVTVIDWGVGSGSKTSSYGGSTGGKTDAKLIIGSPVYNTPESFQDETNEKTTATDIYALGVILYQILTDKLPFERETVRETVNAIINEEAITPEAVLPEAGIDPTLSRLCKLALEKDPVKRQSAKYFSDTLSHFILNEREWEVIDFGEKAHKLIPEEWVTLTGEWKFTGEDWVTEGNNENILLWKTEVTGGFSFSCEGYINDEKAGELSIIGRAPALNPKEAEGENVYNGYFFQVGAEANTVTKFIRNGEDVLAKTDIKWQKGKIHKIEIECDEKWIYGYFDGVRIFKYRELFPFSGKYIGFSAWGKEVHIKPVKLKKQVWGLNLPAMRLADELMQHKSYEIALMQYKRMADINKNRLEGEEALLKSGICLFKLNKIDEAILIFESMRGCVMEPFALVQEGIIEIERAENKNPRKAIELFKEVLKMFPDSQAKSEIVSVRHNIRASKYFDPKGCREEDINLRIEIYKIAHDAFSTVALSSILLEQYYVRSLSNAGRWKEAFNEITEYDKKLLQAQKELHSHNWIALRSILSVGRFDLLFKYDYLFKQPEFLEGNAFKTTFQFIVLKGIGSNVMREIFERKKALGPEKNLSNSHSQLVFSYFFASNDVKSAKDWLKNEIDISCIVIVSDIIIESQNNELFKIWETDWKNNSELPDSGKMYCVYCSVRWEIEHQNYIKASEFIDRFRCRSFNEYETRSVVILQAFLFSLGYLKSLTKADIEENMRKYLAGTELNLARMFLGYEKPEPNELWPYPLWFPEWRLWLGLWLEAKGETKSARKIIEPAIDKRFGLTNSQPALNALRERLKSKKKEK
ncbi:MAG: hypothetical protein A2452_09400 [Candidatus Firestonebacteria bacterium RIFOXYC2_FULL_39_67]|nr:MAG: hypothetical protein A2536_07280 [Candidatus Firestonebacteria bacterium RIFOXYD2_FULL_39_29]OGF54618.1 MAG: hypothetical protein A2452_09400 [Candidatus Firestonebacteria bacterium RIFOXYC2_FULL_39_67]